MSDPARHRCRLPAAKVVRRIEDEFADDRTLNNDYTILSLLGEGGFGRVYLARQHALERDVVIKTMIDGPNRDPRSFLAEAVVLAQLEHPNIVPIYDAGHDAVHGFFFATKYLAEASWRQSIAAGDIVRNVEVLLAVCEALAYAHDRGVLHLDLKPDNILLGSFGEICLTDWGLTAPVPGNDHFADILPPPAANAVYGTAQYMAPEMAKPDPAAIGIPSDIYLLGALLFEIVTGFAPHDFGSHAASLAAAVANRIREPEGQHDLLAVAHRAMATRPESRYPSVTAFRDVVREVHIHRDSIALAQVAAADHARAEQTGHYEAYAEAVFGLKRALQLWPGNVPATERLRAARLAYARAALDRGDLDLAASQLNPHDPEHQALIERLEREHGLRERQDDALDRLRNAEYQVIDAGDRRWVLRHDLEPGDLSRWEFSTCRAEAVGPCLQLSGGTPQVAVLREEIVGNLRIEFEARIVGHHPTDISCFILAPRDEPPKQMIERGYQIKYGAYSNSVNLLIRAGRRMWSRPDSPLVRDRWFRVQVTRVSGVVALRVDGRLVFAEEDPQPISGEQFCRFGFVGWGAAVQYRNLRIYQPSPSRRENPLDMAQRHLELGHYRTAGDLFRDAQAAAIDEQERQRAAHGVAQAQHLDDLAGRFAGIVSAVQGAYAGAIVELSGDGLHVDISRRARDGLAALAGQPLASLNCERNELTDLSPLRGLPLVDLNCAVNRITDLTPLAGMTLERLLVNHNLITDLSPLRGLPLRSLNLSSNPVTDLAPLTDTRLVTLQAGECGLTDLAPLAGCRLNLLLAVNNAIADLSPLAGQPLSHVNLASNRITDLRVLATTPILVLDVCNNLITDIDCLANLELEELHLEGNPVRDIGTVITRLPLTYLSCDAAQLRDVEVLRQLDVDRVEILVADPDQRARIDRLGLGFVEVRDADSGR